MRIANRTILVMLMIILITIPVTITMQPVLASSPDHPYDGAVSGRVTTQDANVYIPHARVAIVNAASGQELYVGETDGMGFFQFPGVANTWDTSTGQYAQSYKIHASSSLFGDGYSGSFAVEQRSTAPANVVIYSDIQVASPTPTVTPASMPSPTATATPVSTPTPSPAATPVPIPADHAGSVSGRVTAGSPEEGVPNAYVAIVYASNTNHRIYTTSTDANGFYQFPRVQDTWNSTLGRYEAGYKIYASHPMFGEGYSNAFAVEARSTAPANVKIWPAPTPAITATPTPPTPVATASPVTTPTPAAVPTPRYFEDINGTVDAQFLNLTGNTVYAPEGTRMDSLVRDGRIAMQMRSPENETDSFMVLRVSPVNNSTATVTDASLVSRKEASLNGRNVTVYASADLNGIPSNATLGIKVTAPEDINESRVPEALSHAGLNNNSSKVLAVVEVIKENLENGRDIKSGSLTITIPRPADFDTDGSYKVIRESDGQYSLLDARLIGSPDVETLTFEIVSPGGFSTFTLVVVAAQPSAVSPAGTSGGMSVPILLGGVLIVTLAMLLCIAVYWQVFRRK
ncbi:hypothetical protein [Methanocella sp. MCL-LM]|uniref:carboxypeptidase-like regulatory domain-containing protein n=1 Tax=Methanocella sp. MCL-LM TaxID=3412035 RepID=UPI003C737307